MVAFIFLVVFSLSANLPTISIRHTVSFSFLPCFFRSFLHSTPQTGEVILDVVAQFVFRPGSGQPTLLWLDSVHTARSTQQLDDHTPGELVDPNSEFVQLTHDGGEGRSGRSWTTFFPPKIGDLVGGAESLGLAGAEVSSAGQRSELLRTRTERFVLAKKKSRAENNNATEESSTVPAVSTVPTFPADANEAAGGTCSPAVGMGEQGGTHGISEDEETVVGHVRNNDSNDCGYQRGRHFNLPTESWAHRSAGRRGLYFCRAGGVGASGGQSLNEQWLRKRSTGTTMRRDCSRERLDLRSAAENQRPWTPPLTHTTKRGAGLPLSECGLVGVDG